MEIKACLVITLFFIFSLCIPQDNAGVLLKNFKSRSTLMKEIEKDSEDAKTLSPTKPINTSKNLIKSSKVKIKSKGKFLGGRKSMLKRETSVVLENTSTVWNNSEAVSANKTTFPKLLNSSVVYLADFTRNERRDRKRRRSNEIFQNEVENNSSMVSSKLDVLVPSKTNELDDTVLSHQPVKSQDSSIGNFTSVKMTENHDLSKDISNNIREKSVENSSSVVKSDQHISLSQHNSSDVAKELNFHSEVCNSCKNYSEKIYSTEKLELEKRLPLNLDSIDSQNLTLPQVNYSKPISSLEPIDKRINANSIRDGNSGKKNQDVIKEISHSVHDSIDSGQLIRDSTSKSLTDNTSVIEIHTGNSTSKISQNEFLNEFPVPLLSNGTASISILQDIETNNESLSTEELISDEFSVKKFMETLKEIVLDDIDGDEQFKSTNNDETQSKNVSPGNSTEFSVTYNTDNFLKNGSLKNFTRDNFEKDALTLESKIHSPVGNHSETFELKNESNKESNNSNSITESLNITGLNEVESGSESVVSSGLDFFVNLDIAKNAINVFNISDSSLTDHVIEDSDMHSFIDLMLPSLPLFEGSSIEKLDLETSNTSSTGNLSETDLQINLVNSKTAKQEMKNESTVIFAEITTASVEEFATNASNITSEASEKKCPPPGICIFWFAASDSCTDDSQCLESKLCCKIRCSKQCVDV